MEKGVSNGNVYIFVLYKILLHHIGQGQWVSLVGLEEGRGVGDGVGFVYINIDISDI